MKNTSWGRELFCAIVLTIICIISLISEGSSLSGGFVLLVILAAISWYRAIILWPKS